MSATGFFGGVLGTLIWFVYTLPTMPSWGWRIPFIIGAVIGLIGFYIRANIEESPEFIKSQNQLTSNLPLFMVLQYRKRNLLCTIGIGATSLIPFYMASVYMGHLMSSELNIGTSKIMLVNLILNISIMVALPLMGFVADKIGKEKLMATASLASVIVAYPLFLLLVKDLSLSKIIFIQSILIIIIAGFAAPSMALLTNLFSVYERCSGIGLGYALGGALLGWNLLLLS